MQCSQKSTILRGFFASWGSTLRQSTLSGRALREEGRIDGARDVPLGPSQASILPSWILSSASQASILRPRSLSSSPSSAPRCFPSRHFPETPLAARDAAATQAPPSPEVLMYSGGSRRLLSSFMLADAPTCSPLPSCLAGQTARPPITSFSDLLQVAGPSEQM
jgi:hypothetical protein